MSSEYFIGLDMGTSAIGWAVTDENYRLRRAKGKDLWGVREFEAANTGAERRDARTNRRRRQREQVRIGLLKAYFENEITRVDKNFYLRLENSKYHKADKDGRLESNNGIFDDAGYTDKEYYAEYPTIFHLRKELLYNKKAPYDVRLVFLAILNLFKHRGHFLFQSANSTDTLSQIQDTYTALLTSFSEELGIEFAADTFHETIRILSDSDTSRTRKLEELSRYFKVKRSQKRPYEFLKCMCGLKFDGSLLFDLESDHKIPIGFCDYAYDASLASVELEIGERNAALLSQMKQIYDYTVLSGILKDYTYLSEARVAAYEKHAEDLKRLKKVFRKYKSKESYDNMFRISQEKMANYCAYVSSTNSEAIYGKHDIHRRNMKANSAEQFYKTIREELNGIEDLDVTVILDDIEKERFLPKQMTSQNTVIANQIHKKELIKILDNAETYLPFLKEIDESGLTVSERILQLFSFQIPYYIGPVSAQSKNGWVVRKEAGLVLPWNIQDKIDINQTSERFIQNLIRSCTYLSGEKVMPQSSLKYERFTVLDGINQIRVNGEPLNPDVKHKIYTELFETGKRVSKSTLCKYLKSLGVIASENEVTGLEKAAGCALTSYGKMYAIFGERLKEEQYDKIAEEIIYQVTVFSDSKNMLKENLQKFVDEKYITKADLKYIMRYPFQGWGLYSEELLELRGMEIETGEALTILQAMWEYSMNFMELINSERFTFKQVLEEKRVRSLKTLSEFDYEDLEETQCPPPIKRMFWQAILVIKEIEQVMEKPPKRIFLNMISDDREHETARRAAFRGLELLNCYKNIENTDGHDWNREIREADKNGELRKKKVFLYYKQMGKDLYTGAPIPFEELFTGDNYNIDHIYPKHYVKDNSLLNNLVLTSKAANEQQKKDTYPLSQSIRENQEVKLLWETLHENGLMNDEKYCRLTRQTPFSDEQLAGFISRQFTGSGMGTKTFISLLKQLLPESGIIYINAENIAEFRERGFLKSRLANEFYHAQDAYLSIVTGNVYYTKFSEQPLRFIREEFRKDEKKYNYHLGKLFDSNVIRGEETAWIAASGKEEGTIKTVRAMLGKNTPLITRRAYDNTGAFYNIMPLSKRKAKKENYAPLKDKEGRMQDVTKYGGYTSLKPAYFIFIECGSEKKRKRIFDVVPLYYADKIKSKKDLVSYCENVLGYRNVRIIHEHLKKDSLIRMDGFYLYLAGLDSRKNVEFRNATSLCVNQKALTYIHHIEKFKKEGKLNQYIKPEHNIELYDLLIEKNLNTILKRSPINLGGILTHGREQFIKLEPALQADILHRIISILSLSPAYVSLAEIGGPREAGRIRISGNMTNREELILIEQSATGLFERRTSLLSVNRDGSD